jgi:magnesium transporter
MADDQDLAEAASDMIADFLDRVPMRDEEGGLRPEYVAEIALAIADWNAGFLRALATELHEADLGDLIEALEPDSRLRLIELAGRDFDFAALNEVDDSVREEILEDLPPETVAEGVRELESDDAIELLQDLPDENKEQILDRLSAQDRVEIERGLLYPENSAGRRMQTDFIAVPPTWTVGQTIDYMRETPDLPDRFYELYALDDGKLLGAVPLDILLRTRRPVPISDLLDEERRRILATDDQEEVARLFGKYNLVAAPVVDRDDRLVGVITIDDVVDVIEEEAEEDMRALGGVNADEELSDTVWTIVRARFPWLFVNMLTACLSAFVISRFEGALEKMVALAVLMPIVASMGGNAGTQTMTVAVRALATRELGRSNAIRVLRREATVGLLNGLSFAVILGVVTGVGGGTLRDVMLGRIPVILHSELYAIPALGGAFAFVSGLEIGLPDLPVAVVAAAACFSIRMLGVHFDIDAPPPPDIDPRRLMTWREARRERPGTGEAE